MKTILPLLLVFLAVFVSRAGAADAIPAEVIGFWRSQDGRAWIELRADGLCSMGAEIGAGGIAAYDPEKRLLSISFRDERSGKEVGKVTVDYDPKAETLQPREEGYRLATYKRLSKEPSEQFKAIDLNKVLHPSP